MTKILVTGVGAIIGYGILRSLRKARPNSHLVGIDIYDDAVGQAWCDQFIQAVPTASSDYVNWLVDLAWQTKIDLIMPGIEQDVHRLSDARDYLNSQKVQVCLNDANLIDLTRDKWSTFEALRDIDEACRIPSLASGGFDELVENLGFPFILKPRRSYASKGLLQIADREIFERHAHKLGTELIAQPIVGSDDEEYTAAVFGDGTGRACASITLQRRLAADGSTNKAWVRDLPDLNNVIDRLMAYFKPIGPTNLQFRRTVDGWKLLEINPRISSATSIRCAFGFNESLMSVEYFLEGKIPTQPLVRPGYAVRYIEDIVFYDRDNF
ncbi:ATP-grasp domain-containing protein [Dongia soli]|uniref:ATP-grasp domain-containing protein n=1 Tax=Dongia soli TaxID=600628 RepID=A0ABU5EDE1_9PROT|nr:ATP-grasp domain-containing protein [Dongia soli]MDY0884070.1 ATP-grasp domain-containing protein [Dongia soli]